MEEMKLSEIYDDPKTHSLTVDVLKFWLMPFVFFVLLGFPTKYGAFVRICSNFAAPAFYILCGFFNLPQNGEVRIQKINKALKRSLVFFIIMFALYTAINLIYLKYYDYFTASLAQEIFRKKTIFNFLVLNIWVPLPMGNSIWFIHSLFYAYVFFYIAEKLKLSKCYVPVLVLLYAFMLASGEFAAIFKFPHFGYNYIPGGALTRAIPYMLIGMLIRRHIDKLGKIPRFVYAICFVAGLGLTIGELLMLSRLNLLIYTNHAIGLGIAAVSICCFALVNPMEKKLSFYTHHSRNYVRRMYLLCQPVALLLFIDNLSNQENLNVYVLYVQYRGIIAFAICFAISLTIGMVKHTFFTKKTRKHKNNA